MKTYTAHLSNGRQTVTIPENTMGDEMIAYNQTYGAADITREIQTERDFLLAIAHAADTLNDGEWLLVTRNPETGEETHPRRTITVSH